MPSLICIVGASAAQPAFLALLEEELRALRAAGEAVAVYGEAKYAPAPGFVQVHNSEQFEAALENEDIPEIAADSGTVPVWIDASDFHRLLVVTAAAEGREGSTAWNRAAGMLPPEETELVKALLAAGAEAVELLAPGATSELSQSWCSGRRVGWRVFA